MREMPGSSAAVESDSGDAEVREREMLLARLMPGDWFDLRRGQAPALSAGLARQLGSTGAGRSGFARLWRQLPLASARALRTSLAGLRPGADRLACDLRLRTQRTVSLRAIAVFDEDGRRRRLVGTVEDVTRERRSTQRWRREAETDWLTGLFNRRTAQQRIAEFIRYAGVHPFALAFFDLKGFMEVNDRHGHDAGDRLLKAVGSRLQQALAHRRDGRAVAARLGGDEFMVLFACRDPQELCARLEAIRDAIEKPLPAEGGESLLPSTSIGATFVDDARMHENDVLREADTAMYVAKEECRGEIVIFEPRMLEARRHRQRLSEALRDAVRDDAFELWYQPIVNARNPAYVGLEALMRWPEGIDVAANADEFVAALEENRLMVELTDTLLSRLAETLHRWAARDALPDSVAFNLSPLQLANDALVERCTAFLARVDALPTQIVFEVTESGVIRDLEAARTVLQHLRARGARIALDDFGVGYSSLAVLHRLPVDILKLDGQFTGNLFTSDRALKIVEGILHLSATLSMPVVAERVECPREAEWLTAAGCIYLQGHHFSPALSPEAITDYTLDRRRRSALRRAG